MGEGHRVALGEAEVGEGGQRREDLLGHLRSTTCRAAMPANNRSRRRAIRSPDRLALIAWRSSSASVVENPATSMAICISCSWKRGTPSVRSRAGCNSG